jgi:hypothetical protein
MTKKPSLTDPKQLLSVAASVFSTFALQEESEQSRSATGWDGNDVEVI